MKSLVIALLVSAVPMVAIGSSIRGPGASNCGTWVEDRKTKGRASSYTEFWILGYLSRAGFDHPGDMIKDVDPDGMFVWVDNYCSAHPLDPIVQAVDQLEVELAARVAPAPKKRR